MRYYIAGVLTFIVILIFWRGCEQKPEKVYIHDTISIVKERLDTLIKEVVKLKEQKERIVYRTKFDTLATIDTVFVELQKCDSVNKIDSSIIAYQDTVITNQGLIIGEQEQELESKDKEIKKEKRKQLLTKIVAVAALIATIIISK